MRGYSYQILRSVEAWLDLPEGQILYLEGAEDLDRIDQAEALVEQVKDTVGSGNLTLRSATAIAAIGNFWQHCERNPDTAIQFRYLTTSGIGRERGEDLPLSATGVEAWNAIRRSPINATSLANAAIIQNFLRAREEFPASLRDFLATAPVEGFISRIVGPLQWVTSEPGAQALRRRIETRLIELGETRGMSAASASGALAKLHLEAWENATDPARPPLRRGDFLRILEDAGSTTIPTQQLVKLMEQLAGGGGARHEIAHLDRAIASPPQSPRRRLPRPELESKISAALQAGTLLIHGSTGMGKTLLAAAAITGMPAVGWIDLRDLPHASVAAKLDAAGQVILQQRGPRTVVLDDFDASGDTRAILPALGRLMASISETCSALLMTSSQTLSPRLAATVDHLESQTFAAPPFGSEEIATYLSNAECPAENVDSWSKIVSASTSGHPQLVDARIIALQQQGWPLPSIGELITPPPELGDVRAEARQLVSALPQDERELLSRASLVIGRISRSRLMAVGAISPTLVEPGHTIDKLTGPWLEVTDTSDLRVSPLLRNLGVDTRGLAWSKKMHGGIAWAWLSDRSLSATDVSTILMHTVLNGDAGPLVYILPSLLDAPADVWKQIGESAGVFAMVGVDDEHLSPFSTPIDTAVLRVLQLRIAAETDAHQLQAVVRRALHESDTRQVSDVGVNFFDFMFLWQLMARENAGQPIRRTVDLGLRFMRLAGKVQNDVVVLQEKGREMIAAWPDLSPIVSFALLKSVSNADDFGDLLDLVQDLRPDERRFLLPSHAAELDSATVVLNQLWLSEIKKASPDWAKFAALLERTFTTAVDSQVLPLASAAATLLVRVTDEDLNDPRAAISAADRAVADLADGSRVLAAKAKVLWRSGAVPEALALYEQLLPSLDLHELFRSDVFREAALTAASAKLWPLCASRFGQAVSSLTESDLVERHVGFSFDLGLALYLAGKTQEAIEAFAIAVNLLIEDGREPPPEPLLSVRQLGSHVLKIVLGHAKGENGGSGLDLEGFIGHSSTINILKWDTQRPASTALVASQLLELMVLVPGDLTATQRIAEWVRASKDGPIQATGWENNSRLAILTGDFAQLMDDTVRQFSYLFYLAGERDAGRDFYVPKDVEPPAPPLTEATEVFFLYGIFSAIITLMARGRVADLPIARWKRDLPADASYDCLREFLTRADATLFGPNDPWVKVIGQSATWQDHALAALGALGRNRSPGELLTAQSLAGHYMNQPVLSKLIEVPFSELVTPAWKRLCDVPALLATPRFSIPALQSAATSGVSGWKRTKAVFEAALLAVPVDVARNARVHIAALPEA
ncbi:hypothetical protein GFL54_34880 [Rhizobium laguerreae]|nr:hypothetical protein [Rhizobium laguerreae]